MVSVYVKEGSGVLKSSLAKNVTETRKTTSFIVVVAAVIFGTRLQE